MYVLILAGGSGTRLWPLSRQNNPKQHHAVLGNYTLLQETYQRARKKFSAEDIFISANIHQKDMLLTQLPEIKESQLILEPTKKNTAAAIRYAANVLSRRNSQAILVTLNADQYIKNNEQFFATLDAAKCAVETYPDHTVLIGINPTYPETGYGYIEVAGEKTKCKCLSVYAVKRFVEKPDLETAKTYLAKRNFLWNPAIFMWRIDTLLDLFVQHLPQHAMQLQKLDDTQTEEEKTACFNILESISIDYGILEKEKNLLVIPGSFGWADIGHWRSVADVAESLPHVFTQTSPAIHKDSSGNFIHTTSGKLVATIGVHDMILIETEDAILVCPRNRAQEVKDVVAQLKKKGMYAYI